MPFFPKASAVTAPTGPAPTTITRSSCFIVGSTRSHSYEFRSSRSLKPRVVYQTFEISNIEGWNNSSTVTLRSIKPCSWAYCVNAVISRMFSSMP